MGWRGSKGGCSRDGALKEAWGTGGVVRGAHRVPSLGGQGGVTVTAVPRGRGCCGGLGRSGVADIRLRQQEKSQLLGSSGLGWPLPRLTAIHHHPSSRWHLSGPFSGGLCDSRSPPTLEQRCGWQGAGGCWHSSAVSNNLRGRLLCHREAW